MTGTGYVCLMNSDLGSVTSGPVADSANAINAELLTAAEGAP